MPLTTTLTDKQFNELHQATWTRRPKTRVSVDLLKALLRDHAKALAALGNRNFNQPEEDRRGVQKIE